MPLIEQRLKVEDMKTYNKPFTNQREEMKRNRRNTIGAASVVRKLLFGVDVQGELVNSKSKQNPKTIKPLYKCLDCPNMIVRGKRCPTCGERKHNQYNMAEPSVIMDKVYKI